MVTVNFDKHDLLCCIEGFARGSHLRQHIWEIVVSKFLPQMSNDEKDFIWYYSMRDFFEHYFGLGEYPSCGAEDFIHAMAALDRRNYAKVTTLYNGKKETFLCYGFNAHWFDPSKGFACYIADEYVKDVEHVDCFNLNEFSNDSKPWHKSIALYDLSIQEIHDKYHKDL